MFSLTALFLTVYFLFPSLFFSSLLLTLTHAILLDCTLVLSLTCWDFSLFTLLQMAEWPLPFISFTFSCFLPSTLFTSNHKKCKPLTLTLFQPKSLSSALIGWMALLVSFLFSSACPTHFAHFSLREVRLLTSCGRQKWHAH